MPMHSNLQQWRLKAKLAKRDEAANGECGIDHGSARSTASVREETTGADGGQEINWH